MISRKLDFRGIIRGKNPRGSLSSMPDRRGSEDAAKASGTVLPTLLNKSSRSSASLRGGSSRTDRSTSISLTGSPTKPGRSAVGSPTETVSVDCSLVLFDGDGPKQQGASILEGGCRPLDQTLAGGTGGSNSDDPTQRRLFGPIAYMEVANPGNSPADIKCKEGVMLYHAKKYSQAAEKYKEVLALDQGHVGCLNAFALLLSQTGNHQGCCEMYQRALQLSPSSTDTLFNYAAYKQLMVGDLVTSEKMYMKALSIEPKQTNCLFNLASLYNDKGNYDACLETYKRILRIKPDHVDSMCNSGQLLQSVFNDLITAEAMYKKALEMQPDHDTCLYNYGLLFLHSDRPKEAKVMLEKCLKVNPKHSWAACDLAVIVHTVEKDSDRAEKMLHDVIQFDPKCANAYCNLGVIYQTLRMDVNRAMEYYQRALSADPRHKHASHNLALLRQSLTDDKAQTPNKDQQGYNLQSGAGTGAETGAGGGGERKHFGGSGVNGMLNNDVGGVRSEDDSIPPGSLAQPNGLPTSTQGPVSLSPTYVYSPAKQKEGGGTAIVVSNSAESLASFKSDQLSEGVASSNMTPSSTTPGFPHTPPSISYNVKTSPADDAPLDLQQFSPEKFGNKSPTNRLPRLKGPRDLREATSPPRNSVANREEIGMC